MKEHVSSYYYHKPSINMLNAGSVRIAIIDDDEDDYFIIADSITSIEGSQFTISWINNYDNAIRSLRAREFDIYLVDYRLGKNTGLELLQEARAARIDEPIVLLTGKGNKDIDIKAMESGATDYLVKSELTTEKLERCIRYSLDRAVALKELRARENKYRNLFTSSKDAVFIATEDLLFTEVNDAAAQLFGVAAKELTNKDFRSYLKDDSQQQR